MEPIRFKDATDIITAPPGYEGKVKDLPVFANGKVTISCWELTDDEFIKLCETKRVYLHILGNAMPPALLTIDSPFKRDKKEDKDA